MKENSKKITKKIKKYHYKFISSQNRLEINEKVRNKNYRSVPLCSYSMHNRKFQKNNKKIKKCHYEFISSQNRSEKDDKERNKNYRSIPFPSYPISNRKFQTSS